MSVFLLLDAILAFALAVVSLMLRDLIRAEALDKMGSGSGVAHGHASIDPRRHFNPFAWISLGLSSLGLLPLGWSEEVQASGRRFQTPREEKRLEGFALFWGLTPLLMLALVFGLLVKLLAPAVTEMPYWSTVFSAERSTLPPHIRFLLLAMQVNLQLFFFNLLPVWPLEGLRFLKLLTPQSFYYRISDATRAYAPAVLILLLIFASAISFNFFAWLLKPPTLAVANLLLGLGG